MPQITTRLLRTKDIQPIATAFLALGWNKPASQYEHYLTDQESGLRTVFVAETEGVFCGYLTVVWSSPYLPFQIANIPEIQDFNVLPQFRRRGIGTQLMELAEQTIAQQSVVAGIGVGMTADYGAAQRLYVLRGYVPDGNGLVFEHRAVKYGEQVIVNDDLVLYFTKRLDS